MKNKILQGDCLDILKTIPDESVYSIVTDPPYELGFMGKSWDNTGIAYNVDMWKECLRVLKPGGHLLAFSGTRTYHRMAVAIEDAGFEVRDMIEWVYGSGFSKCTVWSEGAKRNSDRLNKENDLMVENGWQGWGRGRLKPAHEPICMARKPLAEKTVAENVLKYGTGGINIDESRVETNGKDLEKLNSEWDREWNTDYSDYADKVGGSAGFNMDKAKKENAGLTGRFPANLIHDNSEEVRECFPENVKGEIGRVGRKSGGNYEASSYKVGVVTETGFKDNGNASRFFKSIIYQAKASKRERNMGCEGLYTLKDNTPKEDINEIKHLLSKGFKNNR